MKKLKTSAVFVMCLAMLSAHAELKNEKTPPLSGQEKFKVIVAALLGDPQLQGRASEASRNSGCDPQVGIASWYGETGELTANGEHVKPGAMTAAHKALPFGTRVRVTNQHNGLSIVVRINDRGPYVAGRVIDLSPSAAEAIHMDGIAPVKMECI